ncbi:MAG TPA: TA system VapC family ribonuclease toxin [Burkholderiaceae bacterium]|nr:TA system VapC family ribonuclease toxin [Burkholderiaceae bacterium]
MTKASIKAQVERRALLDVNVLIALLDADHLHHRRATRWLSEHLAFGWASCAVTQNGCVRIMSQPAYPNSLPAARVAERLREATLTEHHLFVSEAPSLLDPALFDTEQLLGHRQVNDAWLLGLAVQHDLRVVTFDGAMPLRAVRGASAHHVVAL